MISNDLLGHSGIITHDVEQTVTPDQYSGLKVIGISANVVDNDSPGVILLQSDGYSQVIEGAPAGQQGVDSYQVVLSRPPVSGSYVIVTALPPQGLVLLDSTNTPIRTLSNTEMLITFGGVTDGTFTLSDGTHTTASIAYNASGLDIQNALSAAGISGVVVTQDGPTYTLVFKGGNTGLDVPVLTLVTSGSRRWDGQHPEDAGRPRLDRRRHQPLLRLGRRRLRRTPGRCAGSGRHGVLPGADGQVRGRRHGSEHPVDGRHPAPRHCRPGLAAAPDHHRRPRGGRDQRRLGYDRAASEPDR